MKKKFLIAMSLAVILALALTSLVFAADPTAYVEFTADAPCAVTVIVINYVDPAGVYVMFASGSTPWTLSTYPSTPVTFSYPVSVNCSGVTYNFVSSSLNSPVTSGVAGTTTRVAGHYALPDTTPPVWTVPGDFSVEATSSAGAIVTYTASASDPDDAVASQSCSPDSRTTFPLGMTTVNCTATDTNGNTGTASFNVTVVDTTPPVLTLPADMTVTATSVSGAVVSFVASANDLVDGPVPVTCTPASGSLFPMGTTTVNCSTIDSRGNSVQGSFNVSVTDNAPPVLTLPSNITVIAPNASGVVVSFVASANDLVDGPVPVTCVPASGSLFPIGTTTVNCSATDSQGNTAQGSFTITVIGDAPPVLTLPSNITVNALNASGAVVSFVASANDLMDGPVPVTCIPVSGSLFPIGTTTVNCSATDYNGNTARGSFTVSVQYATSGSNCKGVPGHQILQPINVDGSSVFKQGSTVPAKFRVCGSDGDPIGTTGVVTSFRLIKIIDNGTVSNVNEAVLSTTPNTEFSAGGQQWIFNISTKELKADRTYVYLIMLNDGSTIQFQFTLK